MSDLFPHPPLENRWDPAGAQADELRGLLHLSHLIGAEPRLVQPGGGNTSIKLPGAGREAGDLLVVKGSGTDLRTIRPDGFSRLSLARLAALAHADAMTDQEMMRFMADCAVAAGPAPSVETPLHALLPQRVIAHTHDVATMSVTNLAEPAARRLVEELFRGEIVYVPYVRPGFPLAHMVARMAPRIPVDAVGLALAHHGLVVWSDDAADCHARLVRTVRRIEEYLATARKGRLALGLSRRAVPAAEARARAAQVVLPVVRGALGTASPVVLNLDQDDQVLAALAAERTPEVVRRGMATPEHILRAGRLPLWLDVDLTGPADELEAAVRGRIAAERVDYEAYHRRHAGNGVAPLDDWAKVVLVPGLGVITAFADKKGAETAAVCYRAVLETIANAETLGGFTFLPEGDVFAFEHWPLERRKVEEQWARDRAGKLVPRQVVVVIGGGSGIGASAARRFAAEGAHVVVADLDPRPAEQVARDIAQTQPGRAVGVAVDVRDDAALDALFERTVLEYGGLDCLFYTAGLSPRFGPVTQVSRADLQRQLDVHYLGAVAAIGRAATIMRRQGRGGSVVASVSKAALAPGKDAVAYGGSKAALLQALRVAAVELGPQGIRVNAINADQVDTPLFRRFVAERAAARGVSVEEQLESYRQRNLMGTSLIPADAVADLAVLLASDKFRYTTGDILTVDGGLPDAFPR
jgi:rhamnose utilization protein RhaD (predicted bifunctional aldolase and dehydrogenase)/NAD(P)-dependent dehydrogenase (short-subunit alcohol dehydrogenase family)